MLQLIAGVGGFAAGSSRAMSAACHHSVPLVPDPCVAVFSAVVPQGIFCLCACRMAEALAERRFCAIRCGHTFPARSTDAKIPPYNCHRTSLVRAFFT
ncbi:hypothetical protein [Burkholderia sp. IDO3]|uniref:hypothetical protein n=1 Tax=Burkholderia sp. IDO3 TaxID=1705310 RepID=UPI0013B4392A|nr:hypothetical protein [Burkholderia sp. IDO3]